jgi:hypothetical protein
VRDPSAGRASPNRCSDLAFGEPAGRDGIDLTAAAGISATSEMRRLGRRDDKKHQKNQPRQFAAQHTHPYTPPRHATVRDLSKPSEWLSENHQNEIIKAIRMGRQFDRIMREARHAGDEERRSYRVCGCWILIVVVEY